MKKSIVVSTPGAKFSALAFKESFEKSIKKVAELGYDGVELAIRNPREVDMKKIENMVELYDLEVPAIGTGQAYSEEGLSFSHPQRWIREKAVNRIKDQIDFASHFKAQVIIGLIRGKIEDKTERSQTEKWTINCLRECSRIAQKKKIGLTLEPLNRYETNFINTVEEGIEFIKKIDASNIGLLIDTFHMNIEEISIYKSIIKAKEYLTHVHFADSNRWAPGSGHLDFVRIIKMLKEIDYKGYISMEILPKPNSDTAAKMAIEYLNKIC